MQSAGNVLASSVAGALWTAVSPAAAFTFLAAAMAVAVTLLVAALASTRCSQN